MSKNRNFINIGNVLSARWLMHEQYAQAYFPMVLGMMQGLKTDEAGEALPPVLSALINNNNVYYVSEFGQANPVGNAPKDSIAVIGLKGPITKQDQFCGGAGTETKAALLQQCYANPNIKGIIIDADSGGGDGNATEFFCELIKNGTKPVVAYISGMAASAAYWIVSACDAIIINGNSSEVGSIGAYISFADFTRYYKEKGIDVHTIYAPQSTEKNKAFKAALAGDYKPMMADLEEFTNFFINSVKDFRSGKIGTDKGLFKGSMYYAQDALTQGLVDKIGNFETAITTINELVTTGSKSTTPSNQANNSEMKIKILNTQTALIAALAISMPAGATEIEHELSAENVAAINAAMDAQAGTASALQTSLDAANGAVTTLTAERDAATAEVATLKAKVPGSTNVLAKADPSQPGAAADKTGIDKYAVEGAEHIALAKQMFKDETSDDSAI